MAIDLNSDIGEGIGDDPQATDAALLDVVTSVNVACGGHEHPCRRGTMVAAAEPRAPLPVAQHAWWV